MASGQNVLEVRGGRPTPSNGAGLTFRPGGSTPGERVPAFAFDDTTTEYVDFLCRLAEHYSGGGLTLRLPVSAAATSGNVKLEAAIRRLNDSNTFSGAHTYSYQSATSAVPGTLTQRVTLSIAFTHGAQMDSLAAGEWCIVRVRRDPAVSGDATGDVYLWGLSGKET